MTRRPYIGFHFALIQDFAVLRPLVQLAASLGHADIHLIVSHRFGPRDVDDRWGSEMRRLGAEIGVEPLVYTNPFEVLQHVGPSPGMLIAGSESALSAHTESHELFRSMAGRVRTVTLQHGLECVGFLHNERHDQTAGRSIAFAADIAVTWFEMARMRSVTASQRSKMYVAGPTIMIPHAPPPAGLDADSLPGLVCENLHSVRFSTGRLREGFLDAFGTLADRLAMVGQDLVLRPHPAGRFTERNTVRVPANVTMRTEPLYDLDLPRHAFAISAPSTILFDFIIAHVPVAVWADPDGAVDISNFEGLPVVATADDWWRFNIAARWERATLLAGQQRFVDGLGIPDDVRGRYEALLALAA